MRPPWPLDSPPVVDRAAGERTGVDRSSADAVMASSGAVGMRAGRLGFLAPAERPSGSEGAFLGRLDGRPVVAMAGTAGVTEVCGVVLTPLREVLETLSADPDAVGELELAMTAVAMVEWHERHAVCGRCGAATVAEEGGWKRRCTSGHDHFPRTDPAVIVAITDEEDRLLLSHVAYHSPGRYTHLAGYVEPGESLEQAAHREVAEEASLRITDLVYVGSQPWPFPASVMVAFRARAIAGDLRVDGVEVTDAMWVTRKQLDGRLAEGSVRLAPPGSIARRLIHDWYGGEVTESPSVGWV